ESEKSHAYSPCVSLPPWRTAPSSPGSGPDERRYFVENAQRFVATDIRHLEKHAGDAGVAVDREFRPVGWRIEHGDRQGCRFAAARLRRGAQPRDRGGRTEILARAREPAVANLDHPTQRVLALTAEKDRRVRLLLGLGIKPHRIEVDELAVELGLVL